MVCVCGVFNAVLNTRLVSKCKGLQFMQSSLWLYLTSIFLLVLYTIIHSSTTHKAAIREFWVTKHCSTFVNNPELVNTFNITPHSSLSVLEILPKKNIYIITKNYYNNNTNNFSKANEKIPLEILHSSDWSKYRVMNKFANCEDKSVFVKYSFIFFIHSLYENSGISNFFLKMLISFKCFVSIQIIDILKISYLKIFNWSSLRDLLICVLFNI